MGSALGDVGRSLKEAAFMFWETVWALVLGFGLSGAVQAFVSRGEMQARLGNHRPATLARASGYGMVSSSCSYAASAMAKSLFQKGADFVAAMVFMFASTNLVIELGIVLIVLIGWQFAASEFIGGAIMIVLLGAAGSLLLSGAVAASARRRLQQRSDGFEHEHGAASGSERAPWRRRLRSKAGWADAATYTMADLRMLRREMVVGYVVAGALATLVPAHAWSDVFITHHGVLTDLENAAVGPLIAVVSFVCSIGNVALAAALWKGGISFGGVVSFIFADLIAMPLLLIYRKFYGGGLALRLFAVFWAVMSLAGLATGAIFGAAGLVPRTRPIHIAPERFSFDYTTVLNILFLLVFGGLYVLYRNRDQLGAGRGYALDPVCGMQVETSTAPARTTHDGRTYWFCSDHCRHRFEAEPERFAVARGAPEQQGLASPPS